MNVNKKSNGARVSLWSFFFIALIYMSFITKYSLLFYDSSFSEVIDYTNLYSHNLYPLIKDTEISLNSTDSYILEHLSFSKNYDFFVFQCILNGLECSYALDLLAWEEIYLSFPYIMNGGLQQNYVCFYI